MTVRPEVQLQTWPGEIWSTLKLSAPLILGQIAQRLMFFINAVMMGHLGAEELAVGTLAMAVLNPILLCTSGVLTAVAPLTAQAIGAGDVSGGRIYFQQGIWLSGLFSALAIPMLYCTGSSLMLMGQSAELSQQAGDLAKAFCLMLPAYMVMLVARNFLAAHGQTMMALVALVLGAALNFFLGYLIVSDVWGLGQYGLFGIGMSSAISCLAIALGLLIHISMNRSTAALDPYKGLWRIHWPALKSLLVVGLPIGGAILLEITFFSASSMLMGYQGADALAAYALSGQLNGLAFAIPTGIGVAAMVRVGWAYGAGSLIALRRACYLAIALGVATGTILALLYTGFPMSFISVFIDVNLQENQQVLRMATVFLSIVAVLQLADAIQGIISHILRGMSDTFVPLLLVLMGYWIFGFPSALFLSGAAGFGGYGVYAGLLIGVCAVAVMLWLRLGYRLATMKQTADKMAVAATPHQLSLVSDAQIKDH